MGYYDRDNPTPPEETELPIANLTQFTAIFVRLVGVVLLLVGLWVSLKVIVEAWDLYRSPEHIERFAAAIERGSNLDKTLAALTAPRPSARDAKESGRPESAEEVPAQPLRLSYFISWAIAILLLMLIGRLALSAVKTGGELVLYDTQVKKLVNNLIKEFGSASTDGTSGTGQGVFRRKS